MALPSFERAIFIARALPSSERRNLPRQRSESLKNFLVPCRFISTSWIEEINQQQAEALDAQLTVEQLQQRYQLLTVQNEMLKLVAVC
ncbi:uncharacterized protein LOC131254022 isoform X2 [Magnolia sinica]|uniref:uncharacterized protein LOC131254022 isoform X2 n=1 Tax=Magnolia sinica TaxID=86752 RepID=UPI00265B42BE|nr:uncharacterized protein LOC131254022 isoform X2 [Magnolia sinica]